MHNRPSKSNLFKGRHFEQEIIILCVRWYLRYKLSYRDLVEMMAERGLSIAHTTILRWVRHYTPDFDKRWSRFQLRQAHHGEWTRPTSGFVASGLISTVLSTHQARPWTAGSAHGALLPRPRHSFAKPYVLRGGHPRLSRWTVMPLPTGPFVNFYSKASLPT